LRNCSISTISRARSVSIAAGLRGALGRCNAAWSGVWNRQRRRRTGTNILKVSAREFAHNNRAVRF
jgi:hypothetical protein